MILIILYINKYLSKLYGSDNQKIPKKPKRKLKNNQNEKLKETRSKSIFTLNPTQRRLSSYVHINKKSKKNTKKSIKRTWDKNSYKYKISLTDEEKAELHQDFVMNKDSDRKPLNPLDFENPTKTTVSLELIVSIKISYEQVIIYKFSS